MPYLRAVLLVLSLTMTLLVLAPIQAFARRRGWALQHKIQMGFCRVVCATLGIKVAAVGAIPAGRPALLVANHLSWTDVIALASLYPLVFLAKSEVAHWPLLGFLARLQGTIFVKRGQRGEIGTVNKALAGVLREGRDVVLFAEGTTTNGDRPPRFHAAHFDAACAAAAAVAPTAIVYPDGVKPIDVGWYGDMTFAPHLWSLMKRGGAHCRVIFGEPIEAAGKDRKLLAAEAEARVRVLLQKAGEKDSSPLRG
jgi:1-acyl-sn-glycerol-3-phosphate acyltransferase